MSDSGRPAASPADAVSRAVPGHLGRLAALAMLAVLAAVLTTAMVLQYGYGEVPCPLCLVERIAMFGICFGLTAQLRGGDRVRGIGVSLLFAVFLLVVSARQTLLDICPLPGRAYVGSAPLGLHMPVWSTLVALAVIAAVAVELALLGRGGLREAEPPPLLARLAGLAGLYVTALCVINLGSVVVQCGLGECHTTGYRLLSTL